MGVTFQVLEGIDKGRVFRDLPTPVTLGREEGNGLRLNDERVSRFHAKIQQDGDDIILDGLDDEPAERWCFRDIAPGLAPESFRWTGEVSTDGRRTWRLDEEMLIRRRPR